MGRPLKLENFDDTFSAFSPEVTEGRQQEQERLAAYDEGYGAGWDDGSAAARGEIDDTDARMRAHLQDLGFTFHEARAHVMRSVQPLLAAILQQAVPRLLQDTLGRRIEAEIGAMIEAAGEGEIALLVPEGEADRVAALLADITTLPIVTSEDPSLAPGMLHLRLGHGTEREIDLAALEQTLSDAFSALDTLNKETFAHG